ncbi:MAG TPA: M48 family metalloprotease [Gemmatimonadales bacterium]|nr:M48 family metalloprotease [Gemmatimonadales bacterium]
MNRIAVALAAVAAIAGCARNPAFGNNQLMLVSESQEIQMGQQADSQVIQSIGLYNDPAIQSYVQDLGKKLAATSERPNLPWTFRVVDDPSVNAFAVPGGFVYVTRGLITHMTNEAELATVMGHEIGHVTARHTAHEMSRQQVANVGLALGSIASSKVAQYAGVASQALGVLFLKFSRDDETQADELGVRYSSRANYDSRQMDTVMTMLDKIEQQSGAKLPQWLETHPDPGNRIQHINQVLAATKKDFTGATINRQPYEQHLDGMIFGLNPREGFFKNGIFYHPDLRFQIAFPNGWQTQNGKSSVAAMSPQQDAIIELTLAQGSNTDQAARAFLSQQGVQAGNLTRGNINGLTASEAPFSASTQNGTLQGQAVFVQYGNNIYQLLAYGPQANWSAHTAEAQHAISSFGPVHDASVLNVQPQHLSLFTLDHRATIAELAAQRAAPVSKATLALINQVDENTPLEPGHIVKWVVGQPLPATP